MAELNACSECGYTSSCLAEFTKHIEQHEEEQRSSGELSHSQTNEWAADSSSTSSSDSSSTPSPTGSLSGDDQKLQISSTPPLDLDRKLDLLQELSNMKAETGVIKEVNGKSTKTVHVCPHCNFTTYMSQHMKSHLEAHERHQGQMYQCDICHMQFSQKANMHRHRMRHSGVKPYECRYCKKRFFRKDQMQEHSMTHIKTGADFDCPVQSCKAQFSQHSQLRTHLDEQHSITPASPASCKRCSLLFANSRRLLLHYQTRHDENEMADPGSPAEREMDLPKIKRIKMEPPFDLQRQLEQMANGDHAITPIERVENPVIPAPIYPQLSSEDLLMMCLANNSLAHPALLAASKIQLNANLRMWAEQLGTVGQLNGLSTPAAPEEEEPHTPSLDSGSSNVDVVDETSSSNITPTIVVNGVKPNNECLHCGIVFHDETMYIMHKGLHQEEDPFRCNLCQFQCGDKYMFNTHVIFASHSA